MSEFDRRNLGEILSDRGGSRFNWMNAYTLQFLDKAISKGAVELPLLYEIYPDQVKALLTYYGWSSQEISSMISSWSRQKDNLRGDRING